MDERLNEINRELKAIKKVKIYGKCIGSAYTALQKDWR